MATTQRTTTHTTGTQNAADQVDHHPGTMDITSHERMFDGFIRFLTWNAVAIIAILIFLALANA